MAVTRTPIVDDDGTGTTGTVIDNAWKTEFYNQIDAALPLSVVASAAGTASNSGAEVMSQINNLPILGPRDTLQITTLAVNASSAIVVLDLRLISGAADVGGIVLTGTTGSGDLAPSGVCMCRVEMRTLPAGGGVEALASGAMTVGTTQARGFSFGALNTANFAIAGNQLLFRQMSGIAAGGSLTWSWVVTLIKG